MIETAIAPAFFLVYCGGHAGLPLRTVAQPAVRGGAQAHNGPHFVPVRRRSENAFFTIGRLDGNDISLPDNSVSRLHALLLSSSEGGFAILDAGSTHGTFVDDAPVPRRGAAAALALRSRNTVRFGQVTTVFLMAADAVAVAGSVVVR